MMSSSNFSIGEALPRSRVQGNDTMDEFTLNAEHPQEFYNNQDPEDCQPYYEAIHQAADQSAFNTNNADDEWNLDALWDLSSIPEIDLIDRFESDFDSEEEDHQDGIEFDDSQEIQQQQEEEFKSTFSNLLVWWIFTYNIAKSAVNALLWILRLIPVLSFLPKSYKTLLKTPRTVDIENLESGKYFHAGFHEGITEALNSLLLKPDCLDEVGLFINIDGVPLSNSSNSDFWPILGRLHYPISSKPFVIGVYHGKGKPTSFNEFLRRFVEEANDLLNNGMVFKWKKLTVRISAFTCDLPALASIKGIKTHSGFFSCTKCETEGIYIHNRNNTGGRVTFPQLDAQLRTNRSFRLQSQKEHHEGRTILERLPIDMVDHFTIDAMHNTFIGVTRKLLHVWYSGRKSIRVSNILLYKHDLC